MKLGVAYYPEHHRPEQWSADLALMKQAGIERIRIAEFAWSRLEPAEGDFHWEWLDQFITQAAEYGLAIILGTPTACPPIWLVEAYPEVIPVDDEGRRNVFGARQHRCYNTPAYLAYSLRIVEELAVRYGGNPNVVAWQIDNEFGGEQKRCYCDNCRKAFQAYLKSVYPSIRELNERWGNFFWSLDYQRFDQIGPPLKYKADLWLKNSPSIEMEYSRFSSQAIVAFCREQAALIREHSPGRPVTTNRFPLNWGDNVHWPELVRDLDAAGMDLYSESLHEIGFYADFNDSLKPGRSWFMEYGPNAANLSDGMEQVRGRGCEWFTIFKFKPFPFGQEQSLQEMLTLSGEPAASYRIIADWAARRDAAGAPAAGAASERFASSGVGIVFHFESSWAYTISRWGRQITDRLHYPNYVIDVVYRSLFRPDRSHRIVTDPGGLKGMHTVVVPLHIVHDPALEQTLLAFANGGGRVLVTSDLFQKNADNVYLTRMPAFYTEVFGMSSFCAEAKGADAVVRRAAYGRGEAVMLHKDAGLADWRAAAAEWGLAGAE
ncbi:MAG: beta-galactosidase [Paenibacillaceae bacterium]|nr:beta-galactosidase [Paenibacillaceae bacterium]